jgi:hypothetical protein
LDALERSGRVNGVRPCLLKVGSRLHLWDCLELKLALCQSAPCRMHDALTCYCCLLDPTIGSFSYIAEPLFVMVKFSSSSTGSTRRAFRLHGNGYECAKIYICKLEICSVLNSLINQTMVFKTIGSGELGLN